MIMEQIVQKHVGDIHKKVKEICQKHLGSVIDNDAIYDIHNTINNFLYSYLKNNDHYSIGLDVHRHPEDPNRVVINPKNLFTFMLMYGVYIPPEFVDGLKEFTLRKADGLS